MHTCRLGWGGDAHLKHVDRLRTGYFHLGRDDGNVDVMDVGHGDPRRGGPPESLEREHLVLLRLQQLFWFKKLRSVYAGCPLNFSCVEKKLNKDVLVLPLLLVTLLLSGGHRMVRAGRRERRALVARFGFTSKPARPAS